MLGIRTGAKRVTLALTLLIAFAILGMLFSSHDPSPAAPSSPPPPSRSLQSYIDSGRAKMKAKNYAAALAELSEGISHYPDSADLYNHRGLVHRNLGDFQNALKDLDKAIALKPDTGALFSNRGNTFFAQGQYRQAIADYTRCIELNAKSPVRTNPDGSIAITTDIATPWVQRARAYARMDEKEKAFTDYGRAINLLPSNSAAQQAVVQEMMSFAPPKPRVPK